MKLLYLFVTLSLFGCAGLPNACVPEAHSYQNYLKQKNIIGKILVVEYDGYSTQHAYLIFNTDKFLCFYDERGTMILGKAQENLSPEAAAHKINLLSGDFEGKLVSASYW